MKTAATPTATAARASTGANSRWPPLRRPLPARLLHRMGGVEHHGIAGLGHDRQAAHVGDQRVVAEADAALADQDVAVAGACDLGHHVLHVPGGEELALLDVDRPAGLAGRQQQIGLAAQEGGDLQHVHRLGHGRALLGRVHVGQHRQAEASRAARPGSAGPSPCRCRARRRREVRFALSKEDL